MPRIFSQLGDVYFRSGNLAKAELCYRQAAARAPGLQVLVKLADTLFRAGKRQDALALAARIALTAPEAAKKTYVITPPENPAPAAGSTAPPSVPAAPPAPPRTSAKLFTAGAFPGSPAASSGSGLQPAMPGQAASNPPRALPPGFAPQASPPAAWAPLPCAMPGQVSLEPAGLCSPQQETPFGSAPTPPAANFPGSRQDGAPAAFQGQASLEPAAPRNIPQAFPPMFTGGQQPGMETMQDIMSSMPDFSTRERPPEDFLSGAFRLASALERESGGKVNFNKEGILTVQSKLLSVFQSPKTQAGTELAKDCAAFLCYFLQERNKGRLIKLPGVEPWGWPMIFEQNGEKLTTYPAERAWRLIWDDKLPEPDWLIKYADWIMPALKTAASLPRGTAAVKSKTASHPERLSDTITEHKRMIGLASTLAELADIEPGRTGLFNLGKTLKTNFKPAIPPSADGWRLLRCCGHMLANILEKEFKAAWYNTDGEDGGWSMKLPWGTFVFPLGKIYKAAAAGEDLVDYYAALLSEQNARK
ncbi:MAG: hypothetical protein A2234_08635 [Elusimicrobia bacterium RIFOXYA2_FULL_58_8]|nr:MAG: hypothetical protein A2234_08635 [Elusimicrobia bacterium RIFOXYA2_FULL_58_8]